MSTYDAKNAVALNILRSWLRAVNIPYSSNCFEADLVVHGKQNDVRILVPMEAEPSQEGYLQILASDITGKSRDRAVHAFKAIAQAVGCPGLPVPFDRPEPTVRPSYKTEEFLVTIRANETRRSPNPSPEKFKQYAHCLKTAANRFLNLNREMCIRWGYELDDLHTIARTLFINFASRYEKEEAEQCENEKLLYSYLNQRYSEFRAALIKRDRSTYPDIDTVQIAMSHNENVRLLSFRNFETRERVFDFSVEPHSSPLDRPPLDRPKPYRPDYLDCSNPTSRKASADAVLTQRLEALPHENMVETLSRAAQSILINTDAKAEAHRRLVRHWGDCLMCQKNIELTEALEIPQIDKDATSINPGSVQEQLVDCLKGHST